MRVQGMLTIVIDILNGVDFYIRKIETPLVKVFVYLFYLR